MKLPGRSCSLRSEAAGQRGDSRLFALLDCQLQSSQLAYACMHMLVRDYEACRAEACRAEAVLCLQRRCCSFLQNVDEAASRQAGSC